MSIISVVWIWLRIYRYTYQCRLEWFTTKLWPHDTRAFTCLYKSMPNAFVASGLNTRPWHAGLWSSDPLVCMARALRVE